MTPTLGVATLNESETTTSELLRIDEGGTECSNWTSVQSIDESGTMSTQTESKKEQH